MEKTFTKQERLAIYTRLLIEVDIASISGGKYLCWKLYVEIVGLEKFKSEHSFRGTSLVLEKFPEFAKAYREITNNRLNSLNTEKRLIVLKQSIEDCKKKVKLKQLNAWLGSDQDNTADLKQMLLDVANGKYPVEVLRSDILSYE